MSEQLQLRRGTAAQLASFTGAQGEAVVDTTNNRIVANDGSTAGGWPAAKLAEVPRVIGQSHIPFILCSSGSMGNNGALSGLTALQTAYPNAYVYLPAGAIASGSAAGWYYAVFSSTTAATVYNNTYSSGTPTIPASPTAFSTTGPGTFTQTTGSLIASYTLTIAGNTIGPNGAVRVLKTATYNSSSNVKTVEEKFGGTEFGIIVPTTTAVAGMLSGFANRGVTNVQAALMAEGMTTTAGAAAPFYGAVDTTQNQNLVEYLELANATDYLVLENVVVELIPGVP